MVIKSKKPKTKVIDHGFNGIIRELRKLEFKPHVLIGYPEKKSKTNSKHEGSEGKDLVTVLDVAIWHEFGVVSESLVLPERSFIRASFDTNRASTEAMTKKLLVKIYSGKMTVEKALDILGEKILNDIKTFLTGGMVEPESQRAKAEGGKTLIDTSQLMNSLTFIKVMRP